MKKYSEELIKEYIEGEEITEYSIEELQSDKEFMMEVIDKTRDVNYYFNCSEKLKEDYDFVCYLIKNYVNNWKFIIHVVFNILPNIHDESLRKELVDNIKEFLSNLIDDNSIHGLYCKILNDYLTKQIDSSLSNLFVFIADIQNLLKIINSFSEDEKNGIKYNNISDDGLFKQINVLAPNEIDILYKELVQGLQKIQEIVDSIFENNNFDLEKMLHEQFDEPNLIEEKKVLNYLINYLRIFDSSIDSVNIFTEEKLENLRTKINIIKQNWDNYNSSHSKVKYNIVNCFFNNLRSLETDIDKIYLTYYAAKQFGIESKMAKYTKIEGEKYKKIISIIDEDNFETKFSYLDRLYFEKVKLVIVHLFFSNKLNTSNKKNKTVYSEPFCEIVDGIYNMYKISESRYKKLVNENQIMDYIFNKSLLHKKYPIIFEQLRNDELTYFDCVTGNLERDFKLCLKEYCILNYKNFTKCVDSDGNICYKTPDYLEGILPKYLKIVDHLYTQSDYLKCDDSTIICDSKQNAFIDLFGIKNIQELEKKTGLFSYKKPDSEKFRSMFEVMVSFFFSDDFKNERIDIIRNHEHMSYNDFEEMIAKILNNMKKHKKFYMNFNYDFVKGEFRDRHSEIFIDLNAPQGFKDAFYYNEIWKHVLLQYIDYIQCLNDNNLTEILNDLHIELSNNKYVNGKQITEIYNFTEEYIKRYGNKKFLNLIVKYRRFFWKIERIDTYNNEIDNEQKIEKLIRDVIYQCIIGEHSNYSCLYHVPEFVKEHPELFIDISEITTMSVESLEKFYESFYTGWLNCEFVEKNPELVHILEDKDLEFLFSGYDVMRFGKLNQCNLRLINKLGNHNFLELCREYGWCLDKLKWFCYISKKINIYELERITFDDLIDKFEIYWACQNDEENLLHKSDMANFLVDIRTKFHSMEGNSEKQKKLS